MTDINVDINEKTQIASKRGRKQKKDIYDNDRQEVLKKLLNILDII